MIPGTAATPTGIPTGKVFHAKLCFAWKVLALASEEARNAPFPSNMTKTALCSLLLPFQNQSTRFDFERKTEGADMKLSRRFETVEAEWSEFRLTRSREATKHDDRFVKEQFICTNQGHTYAADRW
jgi:hypothetical protein